MPVGHGYAHRESRRVDNVAHGALESVDVFVANGQAADFDFGTHSVDAEHKVHGGLFVLVDETEGAEAGVPFGREARRKGLAVG